MHVGVGSENPVKRRAVERVVEGTVESVAVESGVPEQPRSHAETVDGAERRAANALAAGGFDYGVGLEGGVAEFEGVPGLYLVMWSAVTDGDRTERAAGPSVRLPDSIAARVRDGAELGPVVDDELGESGVARGRGAIGVLTGGRTSRADALAKATAGAFRPF
ncbi:MAG: DUF84 family protein [Haloplanus sp.]